MTEPIETLPPETAPAIPPRRRSPIRRVGCTILLILWFALLLLPCALIVIASQGEVSISQGGLPGQAIRLWLINEIDERGFGFASTSITQPADPNTICLQTDTRFLLWAGRAEPVSYCECFARADSDAEWGFSTSHEGVCRADSAEQGG